MKTPFPSDPRNPLRTVESTTTGSAARSGHHGGARSVLPQQEGREYPSAASASPPQYDLPDPHYGDDLAYADYWEHRA